MKKKIIRCKYELKLDYYVDENSPHIWSEYSQKYLSEQLDKDGYKKVALSTTDGGRHRFSVHRLIMENLSPIENMGKFQVDHIDGDKTNNLLYNLRWSTPKENVNNQNTLGNHNSQNQDGINNPNAKLTEKEVLEIINLLLENENNDIICEKYNISSESLRNIKNKKTYTEYTQGIIFPPKVNNYIGNEKARRIISLLLEKKYTFEEIAQMCEASSSTVQKIKYKKTYTHLTKNINFS